MKPEEHARLATLEREYWWHVGRRDILRAALKRALISSNVRRRIADVGCGTGGNLELLAEYGSVIAIDDAQAAQSMVKAAGHDRAVCGSADHLPLRDRSVDVIALLDVLEHIDGDTDVLSECARVLKPGGLLLLTVPAYQWLWSGHDEALGHRRRYVRSSLASLIEDAGLEIGTRSYAVCFLFPVIAGFRVLERVFSTRQQTSYVTVPRGINAMFVGLLQIEARLIGAGAALPFGTSIIVSAVKRSGPGDS